MTKEALQKIIKKEGNSHKFEAFGLQCEMVRMTSLGHWCGYVAVPKDSKLHGKSYWTSTDSENGLSEVEKAINDIDIHGGLTFASNLKKGSAWYFGFDCAHLNDLVLYMFDYSSILSEGSVYKDKEFVIKECESLAEQLSKIIKDHG